MTINGKEFEVTKIKGYSKEVVKLTGHLKELEHEAESIEMPKLKQPNIEPPKRKITGYTGNIKEFENTSPDTSSFRMWDALKTKILQIKPAIQQFKQSLSGVGGNTKELELVKYKISEVEEKLEKAKNGEIHLNTKQIIEAEAELERLNNKKKKLENGGKGNFFSSLFSGSKKVSSSMGNISGVTVKIKNQIKQWGSGMKSGLGHVLKYAGALFSLRSIYSTLSSCASSWLSSQNAGAKQLSANIEYMKYAMGNALAPVIEFITNLVYQLMKAIQSVAYALTGVNIFAKASASSYSSMADSASKASKESKSLAGIDEINNIGGNDSGSSSSGNTAPSLDLSQMDNTPNSIIDAIKNGDWYEVGATIGEKLNDAMSSIPWKKIKETSKNIGTGIAQTLNGFIATTNWTDVGNTFAQGLNTVIEFGHSFLTTFDFKEFGKSIIEGINSFFKNTDWGKLAKTLSEGVKGIFETITGFISNIDWGTIIDAIMEYWKNLDFAGVWSSFSEMLGSACGSLVNLGMTIGEKINEAIDSAKTYFQSKIEECGGNVVAGIFKGIVDGLANIGQWVIDNIFKPFIDGFKNAFGINSPSKEMKTMGGYLVDGLKEGVKGIWEKIKSFFVGDTGIVTKIGDAFKDAVKKIKKNFSVETIKKHFKKVVSGIKEAFQKIPTWFKDKFSDAWTKVKNVFSKGGKVFTGIKDGILKSLKSVINGLIDGINKVIKVPFDGINKALDKIKSIEIVGKKPFGGLPTISVPQIPKLAKGNVATEQTLAIFGEYSGAKSNPEITAPQSIMYDTVKQALNDSAFTSDRGNSSMPKEIVIKFGSYRVAYEVQELIRKAQRQSGTATVTI